jgi:hypothetical protein
VRHALTEKKDGAVSEMAIVNTFTKLIFGDETYSARELSIIDALQQKHAGDLCDSRKAVGEYLRALGVREMIELVSEVRQSLPDFPGTATSVRGKRIQTSATGPAFNSSDRA